MSRFSSIPRPGFGRRPAAGPDENTAPAGKLLRLAARRVAMLADADAVLSALPGPGEALHAIMTGRYDLMQLVTCLLGKVGPARSVRLATLSFNRRNLTDMLALLDGPEPPRLTLLCSAFFRDHNKELWAETLEEFRSRGQQAAAARSHAKVVTLDLLCGAKLALEGSANLRTNSNREQFALVNDTGLHDWHAAWIDGLVSRHEGESADGPRE